MESKIGEANTHIIICLCVTLSRGRFITAKNITYLDFGRLTAIIAWRCPAFSAE